MLVLSAYYLFLTAYSLYYQFMGFYFVPNNRERMLLLYMAGILLMSFLVISPDKETHTISLFTIICSAVLTFSTGIFVARVVHINLKYSTLYTLLVCVLAVSVSVASAFGNFRSYDSTNFFKTKIGKIIAFLPQTLNVLLVIVAIIFFLFCGLFNKRYSTPQSFSTSYSPEKTYYIYTEEEEIGEEKQAYIRVYKHHKDIKKIYGTFKYYGKLVMEVPIENRNNMGYKWLSEDTFEAQGIKYEIPKN